MTRKDLVDTLKDLDNSRLIAQHREAVGFLSISAGPKRDRFTRNSLRLKFEKHQQYLIQVHDMTVQEMLARGFNHYTPLVMSEYPFYEPGEIFEPTQAQIDFDRADLNSRYIQHSKEVLAGERKDTVRWTGYEKKYLDLTQLPNWLTVEALWAIQIEWDFRKRLK